MKIEQIGVVSLLFNTCIARRKLRIRTLPEKPHFDSSPILGLYGSQLESVTSAIMVKVTTMVGNP